MSLESLQASILGKTFEVDVVAKELEQAISKVSLVTSSSDATSTSKDFFLVSNNNKLYIVGYSADTFASHVIPSAKPTKNGIVGIEIDKIQGVFKGRSSIFNLKFSGTDLKFKQHKAKYEGSIVTLSVTEQQIGVINVKTETKKKDKTSVLSAEVMALLREGTSLTSITDVYTSGNLLCYIVLKGNVLQVFSYDQLHLGYYSIKAKSDPFKAALPIRYFSILDKVAEGEDGTELCIQQESIRVKGKFFTAILPITQTKESNFKLINDYLESLSKPTIKFKVTMEKLVRLLDNLITLHSVNAALNLEYKGKELKVAFNTTVGSASDSLKVEANSDKELAFKSDPKILKDIIRLIKTKGSVEVSVIKDKVVMFRDKTSSGASVQWVSSLL